MQAFWSGSVRHFLDAPSRAITGALAEAQIRHHRTNDVQQLRAWEETIGLLRNALAGDAHAAAWHLLLEYPMLRLGRRADAILLTDAAVIVLEIKAGATSFTRADGEQAEDYALDLADFHAGCRAVPIFPVLVATQATAQPFVTPLPLAGVSSVIPATARSLREVLAALAALAPARPTRLNKAAWLAAPYRPVPTIVEAACMLYARHGVAEIAAARAGSDNLGRTTDAILAAVAAARAEERRTVVFVTGIPGAGKTLCGLNAAFGGAEAARATFLTGNPTLVHVLREALARDAIGRGVDRRAARQQMEGAIQALPRFRDHNVAIARAFLRDAPLLLLDEPTAHLDPVTEAEVLDSLKRLAIGRTVILVTHSAAAQAFPGRRIDLRHGRMLGTVARGAA